MLSELESIVRRALWFTCCGQYPGEPGAYPYFDVADSEAWEWLPTSQEQPDPIHGDSLRVELDGAGRTKERQTAEQRLFAVVGVSLRGVPDAIPALIDGPHNYTLAALGGAKFAVRMAAREALLGKPGLWFRVMRYFADGYWPCGIMDRESLIVW